MRGALDGYARRLAELLDCFDAQQIEQAYELEAYEAAALRGWFPVALVRFGQRHGSAALLDLLAMWGGEKPNVPSPDSFVDHLEREVRDHEIRARFCGNNHAELGHAYDLSDRTIRRIVESPGLGEN